MPTPAFGFSVGDFVTGIGALITISKALKETDGAASEYQDVIFELDGLVAILQRLQASHSTRPNLAPGNAIWALAAECQRPIQKFLKHIEKYEKRLGKSSTSSPSSAFRKAKWALVVRDEVKDLRASIGPQLTSISLLLCIEVMDSQTVVQLQNTNIETLLQGQSHQSQVGFAQLNDKIEQLSLKSPPDHQPALTRLTEQVVTGCTEPRNVGQQNLEATHAVLDVLADIRHTIQSVHHSIERRPPSQVCPSASERDTHDEYASPSTPLTMVTKVLQLLAIGLYQWLCRVLSSTSTLKAIKLLSSCIAPVPTTLLPDSIVFEDVLGRSRSIPYGFFREYFLDWQVFQAFLESQFRGLPGYEKVLLGHFHLVHGIRGEAIIAKRHWAASVLPGMRIVMSIIVDDWCRETYICPRAQCHANNYHKKGQPRIACHQCGVSFHPVDYGYEETVFPRIALRGPDNNFFVHPSQDHKVMWPVCDSRKMREFQSSRYSEFWRLMKREDLAPFKRFHMPIRVTGEMLDTKIYHPHQRKWLSVLAMTHPLMEGNFISLELARQYHLVDGPNSIAKNQSFITGEGHTVESSGKINITAKIDGWHSKCFTASFTVINLSKCDLLIGVDLLVSLTSGST